MSIVTNQSYMGCFSVINGLSHPVPNEKLIPVTVGRLQHRIDRIEPPRESPSSARRSVFVSTSSSYLVELIPKAHGKLDGETAIFMCHTELKCAILATVKDWSDRAMRKHVLWSWLFYPILIIIILFLYYIIYNILWWYVIIASSCLLVIHCCSSFFPMCGWLILPQLMQKNILPSDNGKPQSIDDFPIKKHINSWWQWKSPSCWWVNQL